MYAGSVLQAAGTSGSSGTEGFTSTTNMITSFDSGEHIAAFLSNPFPNGFNLPLGGKNGPYSGNLTNIGGGVSESFFSDNANPMIQQWNGSSAARNRAAAFCLEAGYIGGTQHHLIDGENQFYNQIPDQYQSLGHRPERTGGEPVQRRDPRADLNLLQPEDGDTQPPARALSAVHRHQRLSASRAAMRTTTRSSPRCRSASRMAFSSWPATPAAS